MAITAGATDCSTGLAKALYDLLIADTTRNGFIGNTPPAAWQDMVKAQCYAVAKSVADAHNADAYVAKETFSAPLASDVTRSAMTYVDVTGLSFAIGASDVVAFEFVLPCANTGGADSVSLKLTGPATPTAVMAAYEYVAGDGSFAVVHASAFGAAITPAAVFASAVRLQRLRGIIRNGANAGTVQLQFASTGGIEFVTIKAGAFVRYAKVG